MSKVDFVAYCRALGLHDDYEINNLWSSYVTKEIDEFDVAELIEEML